MKLFVKMIGTSIPIIAVFNPMSQSNKCLKEADTFLQFTKSQELTIAEVVNINEFNLSTFRSKYKDHHKVVLPSNLNDIFDSSDPNCAAGKIKKFRELECSTVHEKLQNTRAQLDAHHSKLRSESTIAACPAVSQCNIAQPRVEDCSYMACVQWGEHCDRFMFFSLGCDTYCARHERRDRPDCVARNNNARDKFNNELQTCKSKASNDYNACNSSRDRQLTELNQRNRELHALIKTEKDVESELVERMNKCNLNTCDARY